MLKLNLMFSFHSSLTLQNYMGKFMDHMFQFLYHPTFAAPFCNRKGTLGHSCSSPLVCHEHWLPNKKFYLANGRYANTEFFLAPSRHVSYHLNEFGHGCGAPCAGGPRHVAFWGSFWTISLVPPFLPLQECPGKY
jgi:hypothetical protein